MQYMQAFRSGKLGEFSPAFEVACKPGSNGFPFHEELVYEMRVA